MPLLRDNFNELREWTVRLFVAATPQPRMPQYSVDTAVFYQSPMPRSCPAFPSHIDLTPPQSIELFPNTPPQSPCHEPFFDSFCLEPSDLGSEANPPTGEAPKFDEIMDPMFAVDPFAPATTKWP
jgi:hypothetical protein